jgi:predicted enzyme related to lactoylglutathione lyase
MEQETAASATTDNMTLTGIEFVACYVDDFAKGYEFYHSVLGLEKLYDMGENACYFKLGESSGLYIEGGNQPVESGTKKVRASFVLGVGSAGALFAKLRAAGVPVVQAEPMNMGNDQYWFQFSDPAGNILEVLGGA